MTRASIDLPNDFTASPTPFIATPRTPAFKAVRISAFESIPIRIMAAIKAVLFRLKATSSCACWVVSVRPDNAS